jgi:hypothetical protein
LDSTFDEQAIVGAMEARPTTALTGDGKVPLIGRFESFQDGQPERGVTHVHLGLAGFRGRPCKPKFACATALVLLDLDVGDFEL